MRIKRLTNTEGAIVGYVLWLSKRETWNWTRKPGASWPCSTLEDKSVCVDVDRNGYCGLTVNGRYAADVDGNELSAIVADHIPADCQHLWPTWKPVMLQNVTPNIG